MAKKGKNDGSSGDAQGVELIREQRDLLRGIVEHMTDAVFLERIDGRIHYSNQAALEIFGYSLDEMLTKRVVDLVPEGVARILPDLITEDTTTHGAFIWASAKRKDGTIFQCETSTRLISLLGEEYVLACMRYAGHKMTYKKKKVVVPPHSSGVAKDYTPVYALTWQDIGEDFVLIGHNTALEHATGGKINEYTGKRASEIFSRDREVLDGLRRCYAEKRVLKHEMFLRAFTSLSNTFVAITYTYVPPNLVITYVDDITERQLEFQNILENLERFKAIYMGAPFSTMIWRQRDRDFVLLWFNNASKKLTGGRIVHLMDRPAGELFEDRKDILADMRRCFVKKDTVQRETAYHSLSPDQDIYVSLIHKFIQPDLLITHIFDITEFKRIQEELRLSREDIIDLYAKQIAVLESERKRISQELHDGIGQYLSSLKYSMENLLDYFRERPDAYVQETLGSCVWLTKVAINDVRRMSVDLRPSILDNLGIIATISWFCREFRKLYPRISITVDIRIKETDVRENLKIVLYRMLQEAMNNVAQHSQADTVHIAFRKRKGLISFVIADNGRGFDLEEVSKHREGLGLAGLKERVHLSNGTFEVDSVLKKGTMLEARWMV